MLTEKESWPDFLQRLASLRHKVRPLGGKATAGHELFLVDLADWRLRFSTHTPFILVKAEAAGRMSTTELAESLRETARQHGWHRECVVLLESDGQELRSQTTHQYSPRLVILDLADQEKVLSAPSLKYAMLDIVCERIPISSLAPYEMSAPVAGAGFFGREREIEKILSHPNSNFAITGIRRVGKTSLLNETRRLLIEQGEDERRIVWLDCSILTGPQQFAQEVVRFLNIKELPRLQQTQQSLFFFADFLKRMTKYHHGQIIILLDEADEFLSWARDASLHTVRASVNSGDCRYILTGFQNLMGENYHNQSPLYLALNEIRLKPLEKRETAAFLEPMKSLRVRIENENEIVTRIQAETRGLPHLVQFYCTELIDQLGRNEHRTISPASLDGIYTSEGFRSLILNWFRDNVAMRDKMLVYSILASLPANKESFSQEDISAALNKQQCPFPADDISRTCDRLELAGVFIREGTRYEFAIPIFPRVLRSNFRLPYLVSSAKKELGL
ncbi:MAG TPA: AAA family ATPase [Blastocatellia bacterium]|nr:AAA family ATPase [Blastocatellia bacterium]